MTMSQTTPTPETKPKGKKSVALSGVVAYEYRSLYRRFIW